MAERVTVIFAERSFGRGSDMREDETRCGLGGHTVEIRAVPDGYR